MAALRGPNDVPSARSSTRLRALSLAASLGAVFVVTEARAFEEQWHLGAKGGFATLRRRGSGPALGVHAAYGLTDMFDVHFEGLASRHDGADGTDVFSASLGAAYKIDVFEWIPYLGAAGGYYHFAGRPGSYGESGGRPGASVQAGIDYLLRREIALGLDLRWHTAFGSGLNMPLLTVTLGAEYRFGF